MNQAEDSSQARVLRKIGLATPSLKKSHLLVKPIRRKRESLIPVQETPPTFHPPAQRTPSVVPVRISNEGPPVGIHSQQKKCFALTHHRSPITYHILERAVSSVVEHLVYTERVGGSKPSPPTLHFRFQICHLRLANARVSRAANVAAFHVSLAARCTM
jgi:hypothetical protein